MIKKYVLSLAVIIFLGACAVPPPERQVDKVVVYKSQGKMSLMKKGVPVRVYDVSFGANPIGHKVQEGDMRTPEGRYDIIYKNYNSQFYKSLAISYPNARDIARAQARGVDPGGAIVIHGMPNAMGNYLGPLQPYNWTEGCIAVRNHEMDDMFRLIEVDTPIVIYP